MRKKTLYVLCEQLITRETQQLLFTNGCTWGDGNTNVMPTNTYSDGSGSIRFRINLETKKMSYYTHRENDISDYRWYDFSRYLYPFDSSNNVDIVRFNGRNKFDVVNIIRNIVVVNYKPRAISKSI